MQIFERVSLKNMTSKNRLVRSATWDALAAPDGSLNEEIYDIYRELAMGGVGTIVTGLTDVSPYDWALCGNMRLCSDLVIPDYKRLTDIVHEHDCRILVQLNINEYYRMERRLKQISVNELTATDIANIVKLFTDGAVRADRAGFDGVHLHLAYGWLLSRFINPETNHRTDLYGGSTENRVRIVLDIMKAIRKAVPNLHLSAKFSFFADTDGDFNISECVAISKVLSNAGIDSLEVLGRHSPKENGTKYEACYLDLALAVKAAGVDVPIILTGNNHDIVNMESLLQQHGIEMFGLSRPLIREPELPEKWSHGSTNKAKCISCGRCYTTHGKRCIFNVGGKQNG